MSTVVNQCPLCRPHDAPLRYEQMAHFQPEVMSRHLAEVHGIQWEWKRVYTPLKYTEQPFFPGDVVRCMQISKPWFWQTFTVHSCTYNEIFGWMISLENDPTALSGRYVARPVSDWRLETTGALAYKQQSLSL